MPAPPFISPRVDRARHRSLLRKDLCASVGDGSAYSIMVGIGETYLPAFVLALGMTDGVSGLITTVPLMIGSVLQLVSPTAVRWLGSNRRWTVYCVITQSLTFIPLVVAAVVGSMPKWAIFALASIYWGASLGTGPSWNSWMGAVVPARIRARFFSRRSRIAQLSLLFGFLTGGILLQLAAQRGSDYVLWAFALLFSIAGVCRFISGAFLFATSEQQPPGDDHRQVPFLSLVRGHGSAGLLLFLLTMQVCVQISGPYFTAYMVHGLDMPYWQYAAVCAAQYASKMCALPYLGKLAQRWGADRLLWMMSLCVVPLAALWIISSNFYYLIILQILSGIFWGGYELAYLLLFFETLPPTERISLLTKYNVAHSFATCFGSVIGFLLLRQLGETLDAYYTVFGLSTFLRTFTVFGLVWLPLLRIRVRPLVLRSIGMRPTDASLDEPVLSSIEDD